MNWMEKAGLSRSAKKDILDEAEKWWERMGRHLVPSHVNENTPAPHVSHTGPAPIGISKSATMQDLPYGILRALPWDELNAGEQAQVMFQYFSNIWLPEHPEVKLQRRVH